MRRRRIVGMCAGPMSDAAPLYCNIYRCKKNSGHPFFFYGEDRPIRPKAKNQTTFSYSELDTEY